jgi:hypothetical protein
MNRMAGVVLTVGGALVAAPSAASVAPTTLAELSKRAKLIAVGRVLAIHEPVGSRVAEVEILQVVKGPLDASRVFVFAQPTWTCDIADAKDGETALFFLADDTALKESRRFWRALNRIRGEAPLFTIEWSGRGRMPIRVLDGAEFVTLWTADVQLPPDLSTVDGPEPEFAAFIRSLRLQDLLTAVRSAAEQPN